MKSLTIAAIAIGCQAVHLSTGTKGFSGGVGQTQDEEPLIIIKAEEKPKCKDANAWFIEASISPDGEMPARCMCKPGWRGKHKYFWDYAKDDKTKEC